MKYLCEVGKSNGNADVRVFAIDLLASMILEDFEVPSDDVTASSFSFSNKTARAVRGVEDLFRTSSVDNESAADVTNASDASRPSINNFNAFGPLMDAIANTPHRDASEAGLLAVQSILESHGQALKEEWQLIIKGLAACSGNNLAFQCLKFIVDDFLEFLNEAEVVCLLNSCSAFAASTADVNTSLTAIAMVWTISDHFKDNEADSPNMKLWKVVFSKLISIGADHRSEVRNCAVDTLFSCVSSNGKNFGRLKDDGWPFVIESVILCLLQNTDRQFREAGEEEEKGEGGEGGGRGGGRGFTATIHHSRNSPRKQWAETYKMSLQGMGRVLRQFVECFKLESWFDDFILKACAAGKSAISSSAGGVEVASAGIEFAALVVEVCSCAGPSKGGGPVSRSRLKVVNGSLQLEEQNREKSGKVTASTSSGLSATEVARLAKNFLAAFENLESIPKLTQDEDLMGVLVGGIDNIYTRCASVELANERGEARLKGGAWVLDR